MYYNYPRVKNILILQSIYYFSIFQKLINKTKNNFRADITQEDQKLNLENKEQDNNMDEVSSKQKSINENVFLHSYCIKTKFMNPTKTKNATISTFPALPNISGNGSGYNTTYVKPLNPLNQLNNNSNFTKDNNSLNISNKNIPSVKVEKNNNNNILKVGIIGCGVMGSALLKLLMKVKDVNLNSCPFKILVSTRTPSNIDNEIRTALDDFIEIFMNNERV